HGADSVDGDFRRYPVRPVVADDADHVAAAEPEFDQAEREVAHPRLIVAPGEDAPQPEILFAQRDLVAKFACIEPQQFWKGIGLRKRVELARAMALEPQLILLDEPMAGMNFEEKEDMARYVVDLNEEFGMTVVMIEHDMGVVMDISHRVMVLDFGRKIAEGDPASVLADPHVKRAYLGEEDEALVDPDDVPAPAETAA
ncbi:MAG: branched-chain amino acid transport system ATP-binding protein, partial [Bradyrhizobium sp.]|nr:branched-chain amino acid transport system ATP-binding protein [Bradyrhizobium sp.]